MEVNLTDWLGDNSWAIWLSLAFLLGIAEIMSLDLVLIMLAVGALAGAARRRDCAVTVVAADLGRLWRQHHDAAAAQADAARQGA